MARLTPTTQRLEDATKVTGEQLAQAKTLAAILAGDCWTLYGQVVNPKKWRTVDALGDGLSLCQHCQVGGNLWGDLKEGET